MLYLNLNAAGPELLRYTAVLTVETCGPCQRAARSINDDMYERPRPERLDTYLASTQMPAAPNTYHATCCHILCQAHGPLPQKHHQGPPRSMPLGRCGALAIQWPDKFAMRARRTKSSGCKGSRLIEALIEAPNRKP